MVKSLETVKIIVEMGRQGKTYAQIRAVTGHGFRAVSTVFGDHGLLPRPKGMANCSPEVRRRVATVGGNAVSKDRGHMKAIGHLGGIVVVEKYGENHMRKLAAIGGAAIGADSNYMAKIGRLGGLAAARRRREKSRG